jgi:hypothetical protein
VAEEMRQVAQHFKADELAIVRDFMRQAKEVFQRHVTGAVTGDAGPWDGEHDRARTAARPSAHTSAHTATRSEGEGSGGAPEGK